MDNTWVVPYNPYLVSKYNCHINVEICTSVRTVKCLHKYIHKGVDRGVVNDPDRQEPVDEIKQHLEGRFVCAPEACWRILSLPTHDMSHSIIHLPVHCPGQQLLMFNDTDLLENVID